MLCYRYFYFRFTVVWLTEQQAGYRIQTSFLSESLSRGRTSFTKIEQTVE
jgi:hypothetical protein